MSKQDAKRALTTVMNRLDKKFGSTTFRTKENRNTQYEVVSTGSAIIDDATGIGGLAIGKLYEISGQFSSGKSSICNSIVAQFQKAYPDKYVAYIDPECSLNLEYMEKFGVDTSEEALLIANNETAEEGMEIINQLAESGAISLIIYDSIPAAPTKAQVEKAMDEMTMGALARCLSNAVPQIKTNCNTSKTTVIFVNQIRANLSPYSSPMAFPGGSAVPFYTSIRMLVSKKDVIVDSNKKSIGQEIGIKFIKNKLGTPYATIETKLLFGKGFDFEFEYTDIAETYGVIVKGGSWYSFNDSKGVPIKFQGKPRVADYFKNNPDEFESIKARVKDAMQNTGPLVTIVPPTEGEDYGPDNEPD